MIKEYQLRKLQNSYEVTLYYKGVKVRVAFTGGNVYRDTMPTFRTDNLFKMKAIEASELFKNKEVVLLRTIGKQTDSQAPAKPQPKKGNIGKPVTAVKTVKPEPEPAPEPVTPPVEAEPEPTPEQEPAKDESKEFANLGEAILYIAQMWQLEAKTEKEAREILKAHGINPKIKKG